MAEKNMDREINMTSTNTVCSMTTDFDHIYNFQIDSLYEMAGNNISVDGIAYHTKIISYSYMRI